MRPRWEAFGIVLTLAIMAAVVFAACGPAVNTGSRDEVPKPERTVGTMGVWYYGGATALDKDQLDETLREHQKLCSTWAPSYGVTYPKQGYVQWYRDFFELQAALKQTQHFKPSHKASVQLSFFDPMTDTIHVVATLKNTTSRHNGLAGQLLHFHVADWLHQNNTAWPQYQADALALDVRLEGQR